MILPYSSPRNPEHLEDLWGGGEKVQFSEYFDEEWFLQTLGEVCPKMQVYKLEEGMEITGELEGLYTWRQRRPDHDDEAGTKEAARASPAPDGKSRRP